MKKLPVRVITDSVTEEGDILPVFELRYFSKESTKYFSEYEYLLLGLSPSELSLILYLVKVMRKGNLVKNNVDYRRMFIDYHTQIQKRIGSKEEPYKDNTIQVAFKGLVLKGLLSSLHRGLYRVNPILWFNGNENERAITIRKFLEETGQSKRKEDLINQDGH